MSDTPAELVTKIAAAISGAIASLKIGEWISASRAAKAMRLKSDQADLDKQRAELLTRESRIWESVDRDRKWKEETIAELRRELAQLRGLTEEQARKLAEQAERIAASADDRRQLASSLEEARAYNAKLDQQIKELRHLLELHGIPPQEGV